MARPKSVDPKTRTISLRVTESEYAKIDKVRGGKSMTEHLRQRLLGGR